MNTKRIFVWLLGIILVLLIYSCFPTLRGLYSQKIAVWEEDAYVGKPLDGLENMLRLRGVRLHPVHEGRVYPPGHPGLKADLKAFEFIKGREYKWFIIGSAVNVGYVIAEERAGDLVIVKIIRGRSMNSL